MVNRSPQSFYQLPLKTLDCATTAFLTVAPLAPAFPSSPGFPGSPWGKQSLGLTLEVNIQPSAIYWLTHRLSGKSDWSDAAVRTGFALDGGTEAAVNNFNQSFLYDI